MGSLKREQMNSFKNRNRVTDVENKLMVTMGEKGKEKLGVWDPHAYTVI